MTEQLIVAQSHVFSLDGQVHYDFMCSISSPADGCILQIVWNHEFMSSRFTKA